MALTDLATSADLSTRGVDVSDTALVAEMLAVASSTIRGAAGSPILSKSSTITLIAWGDHWLDLPGKPVTAVSSVSIDGTAITDFTHDSGSLWRLCRWGCENDPATVEVTYTHGLAAVPADIVNLTCDLATAGMLAAPEGAADGRVAAERIDDYSVTYRQGAEAVASIMDLPAATRLRLRARFGGSAALVGSR